MKKLNAFQILKDCTSFDKKGPKPSDKRSKIPKVKAATGQIAEEFFEESGTLPQNEEVKVEPSHSTEDKWKNFNKRHSIKVEGDLVPHPFVSFKDALKEFKIPKHIISNMIKNGWKRPTPIQMQAMPCVFNRRNLLAISPTGSGKTIAYAIPLLTLLRKHEKGGCRALVFAPTHELAAQLYRELIFLNDGRNGHLHIKLISKVHDFKTEMPAADILVTTPLKFLNGLTKKRKKSISKSSDSGEEGNSTEGKDSVEEEEEVNEIDAELLTKLQFVVLDEADKYFELGFIDQIGDIMEKFKDISSLNYLMFSATIQEPIETLFKNYLFDPVKIQIGGRNNVLKNIEQKLLYVSSEYGKLLEMKKMINSGEFTPNVLVFVQSKDRALQLQQQLGAIPMIRCACIHSGLSKKDRDDVIEKYRRGELWTLISTELMGRGVDFRNVNLVINYDFPQTIIDYIHRVGRTGRAARRGNAITFYTDADRHSLKGIAHLLKQSGCEVSEWMLDLKKVTSKEKKHRKLFPVKREPISQDIQANRDKRFWGEMKARDKLIKKLRAEDDDEGDGRPQNTNDEEEGLDLRPNINADDEDEAGDDEDGDWLEQIARGDDDDMDDGNDDGEGDDDDEDLNVD